MPDLIPFVARELGHEKVNTVNARDLYAYLEMSGDYNLWIKRALKRSNLIENIDFVVSYQVVENPKGGRPASEHHLTFDAAKHVAMMSSATKGHEVRAWFIAKEKELAALHSASPKVRDPAIQMLIDMAVNLDAARTLAEEAKAEAVSASANADRALRNQLFFTIAEYVYVHDLHAQLPPSAYRACSDFLQLYCMDNAIPFRRTAVGGKSWNTEYSFLVNVYTEVLPGWLKRRFAQDHLRMVAGSTSVPTPAPLP